MASSDLKITATSQRVREYRHLLTAEWSQQTLDAAFKLFRAMLVDSGIRIAFDWEQVTARPSAGPKPYPIPARASEGLREFIERFNASLPPELPEAPAHLETPQEVAMRRLAVQGAAYVGFPNWLPREAKRIGGSISFLRDVQSLICNLVIEFLLADLEAQRLVGERNHLINELFAHVVTAWDDDVAHQWYLRASLFDALGDTQAAGKALLNAFRATAPDEHDYMTKAQAYWSHLLDQGDFESAERFMVFLARSVPHEHLEEVRELTRATYEQIFRRHPTN